MTTHKLTRSGNAPLLIDGDLVAEADGQRFRGKERRRWLCVRVFRLAGGRGHVGQVEYHSDWEGEAEWSTAAECPTLARLVEWLNVCDRQPAAIGYPVGPQFEERQRRLLAELDAQYAALVSDALNSDSLDWANDRPPSPEAVAHAIDVLDDALQGDVPDELPDAIGVIQSARHCDVLDAICPDSGQDDGPPAETGGRR